MKTIYFHERGSNPQPSRLQSKGVPLRNFTSHTNYSFLRSGVETKHGVEFRHSTRNASRTRRKVRNVRFPLPTQLYAGYSVKLIYLFIHLIVKYIHTYILKLDEIQKTFTVQSAINSLNKQYLVGPIIPNSNLAKNVNCRSISPDWINLNSQISSEGRWFLPNYTYGRTDRKETNLNLLQKCLNTKQFWSLISYI